METREWFPLDVVGADLVHEVASFDLELLDKSHKLAYLTLTSLPPTTQGTSKGILTFISESAFSKSDLSGDPLP